MVGSIEQPAPLTDCGSIPVVLVTWLTVPLYPIHTRKLALRALRLWTGCRAEIAISFLLMAVNPSPVLILFTQLKRLNLTGWLGRIRRLHTREWSPFSILKEGSGRPEGRQKHQPFGRPPGPPVWPFLNRHNVEYPCWCYQQCYPRLSHHSSQLPGARSCMIAAVCSRLTVV